ncbi:MAG: hypothetical protein ACJ0DD_03030 [Paracoccaceae bacterium]
MFVRMSYWKCKKEFWTEDFKLFNNGAVPIMKNHNGFIKAMLLGGKDSSERIAFTQWDNEQSYNSFSNHEDLKKIIKMFDHMYEKKRKSKTI